MNAVVQPELTIDNFEAGNVDPERFNHEAHVFVGWLYANAYPMPEAIEKFDAALRRLVIKVGAEGKYHATLTWFFMLLIGERLETDETWTQFYARNADIFDSKTLLSRYYSREHLFSELARQRFAGPSCRLEQPLDLTFVVDGDSIGGRNTRQSGHCHNRSANHDDKLGTSSQSNFANWYRVPRRSTQ